MIRTAHRWADSWLRIDKKPEPPHVRASDVWRYRELWSEYVHDAHGVQVLTDAHLARAADLGDWDVQRIAPGRHLLQARDLAPWYAGDQPDPDILAAARRDFGAMLFTPDALAP